MAFEDALEHLLVKVPQGLKLLGQTRTDDGAVSPASCVVTSEQPSQEGHRLLGPKLQDGAMIKSLVLTGFVLNLRMAVSFRSVGKAIWNLNELGMGVSSGHGEAR